MRVSVVSFPRAANDEVLVRALTLPSDVKVGAPFEVSAEVYSSRAQPATLTLYRDEFINPLDGRKTVELAAGANTVKWKAEVAQAGFSTFKAVVSAAPKSALHDTLPGNNAAVASLSVKGKPRVLYVEGEPARRPPTWPTRSSARTSTSRCARATACRRRRGSWPPTIWSSSPTCAQTFVGPAQMAALEGYVRDLGGGFIMAGGENSFGAGGYTGSRLEKLLPVRFDTEKKRDQPGLALALVIDRSGSMTGEKLELAKEAAKATAELLGPDDLLGVIAFDSQPTTHRAPAARGQPRAHRQRHRAAAPPAAAPTSCRRSRRPTTSSIRPAPSSSTSSCSPTGRRATTASASWCDEMAEHKITISAVGVGAEADKTLLTMIAERGGGRFYYTQSAQNIPKIFTKETTEVARNALVEEQVGVHVVKRAELLDGVGIESAPPLRGYVSTKPKPLSDVILVSDLGEPILARWRVGLGQAAAFTSDVKNRWAVNWLRWPGYGKFWAHLVRSTMRHATGGSGRSYELGTDVDPPRARVTVDAVGADDKFVSGLETTLQVIDPEHPGDKREFAMPETAPGHYAGEFTLGRYGTFLLRALHRSNGQLVAESTGALSLPYPREYLALPPDQGLLARVASTTGGRVSPTPEQLFDPAGERVTYHRELWPFCLWLAALLLLLDVAARRVRFTRH